MLRLASSIGRSLGRRSTGRRFRANVAGLLSDPDRSRARSRLQREGFLNIASRLTARATNRRFAIAAERLVDIVTDGRLVLAGSSAARALALDLPSTDDTRPWPVEAYVSESRLVAVVEHHQLERDEGGDLLLRSVPEPWPFPPHARVVAPLVAELDLAESTDVELSELGAKHLAELASAVIVDWQQLWGGKTSGALRLPVSKRGASPFRRRLNQAGGCRATTDAPALPSAGSSPTEPPLPFRSPSVLRFDRQDAIGNVPPTRRVEDGTAAPAPRSTGLAPRLPCLYAGCRRDMLVRGCPDHQRHSSQTARCVPLRTRG
jgi:hypothetical protein